jgi:hypothetical protein
MSQFQSNRESVAISLIEKGIEMLKNENKTLVEQNESLTRQLNERQFMSKSAAARVLGVSHTQIRRLVDAGKLKEQNGRISRLELYRFADPAVAKISPLLIKGGR